jgi:hypothetical protein
VAEAKAAAAKVAAAARKAAVRNPKPQSCYLKKRKLAMLEKRCGGAGLNSAGKYPAGSRRQPETAWQRFI